MTHVVFYEVFEEEEKLIRKLLPKHYSSIFTSKTIQSSGHKVPLTDFVCIRTQSVVPVDWRENIKGILTRSQGYDHLTSMPEVKAKKIHGGYLGCYCASAVAGHALLMMQMLLRKVKKQMLQIDSFNREGLTGKNIHNCKVLVVGVGNIGKEIVKDAEKLGLTVKGTDIVPRMKSLEYVSLKKGLPWADVIFCALPLTEQTRGLLNYENFKNAGKGKYLINISRGEVTPSADLKRLLDEHILAGLSLDVYENENEVAEYLRNTPKKASQNINLLLDLKDRDNVIFTPHNAFNTQDALEEKCRLTVQEVIRFLKTKQFRWKV